MLETTIEALKPYSSLSSGYDLGMLEVSEIAGMVEEQADRDCILIFWSSRKTKRWKDEIAITVIATGFGEGHEEEKNLQQAPSKRTFSGKSTKERT